MKIVKQLNSRFILLYSLLAASLLISGCATYGRHIFLKEYGPTVPKKADSPLKGVSVCVKTFSETFRVTDLVSPWRSPMARYCSLTRNEDGSLSCRGEV
jgi:hypothetical protein